MGERCPEIGSIDVRELLLWSVDILAPRAIHLSPCQLHIFTDADGNNILFFAKDSRTGSEFAGQVFFSHDGQAFGGGDVPGVDESVEFSCLLIYFQEP